MIATKRVAPVAPAIGTERMKPGALKDMILFEGDIVVPLGVPRNAAR